MRPENIPKEISEEADPVQFRIESLKLLRHELQIAPVPEYPKVRLTFTNGAKRTNGHIHLPKGPWKTAENNHIPSQNPEDTATEKDTFGRPVHPWIDDMLKDDQLGVVTGRGSYYEWGPNYTADPIIIRHDYSEPVILLIKRQGTGSWALPGGHVDHGEEPLETAIRETREETNGKILLDKLEASSQDIYQGPVADVRMTANAWPETTAYRFDIPATAANKIQPIGKAFPGDSSEVDEVVWTPLSRIHNSLYGSHSLLIKLALQQDSA